MTKFEDLNLSKDLLKIIKKRGFEEPTEIQEKSIPYVLDGKDVVAESATGSGKTLAFSAGIIESTKPSAGIQSVIIAPTRELANQITQELDKFSKFSNFKTCTVYGGVSINPQIKQLKSANIVIATPGRFIDHMQRRTIKLDRVNTLILDEADRMFEMGFIDDIKRIISGLPKKRQTLLFSATISRDVAYLAKKFMHDPIKINVESRVDPSKLTQFYYDIKPNEKFSLLYHLLKEEDSDLVMVFCNTRKNVDFVAKNLQDLGINALAIHGGFSQDKRTKTMDKFNAQSFRVLVCTDVAARGLDIKGVSHVYNYDVPNESKQYVHRIGRTARAGKEGIAVTLLCHRDYENFSRVMNEQHVNVIEQQIPAFEKVKLKRVSRDNNFRRRPRRNNNPRHRRQQRRNKRVKR
jgi:ATP-dependent RNA helicase DeaD